MSVTKEEAALVESIKVIKKKVEDLDVETAPHEAFCEIESSIQHALKILSKQKS